MANETLIWLKNRELYNHNGVIDNISMIVDKQGGLVKYGNKEFVEKEYKDMLEAYIRSGFKYMCDTLIFVDFSNYRNILTLKQVGTFVNYALMVSANGEKILSILSKQKEDMREEIYDLVKAGFEIDEYI